MLTNAHLGTQAIEAVRCPGSGEVLDIGMHHWRQCSVCEGWYFSNAAGKLRSHRRYVPVEGATEDD